MEAGGSESSEFASELDRVEAAVAAGDADLRTLGFWRLVSRVKRDPDSLSRFADQIGRIDRAAFRARVRLRAPVWSGNAILLAGVVMGIIAVIVGGHATSQAVAGVAFLVAGGAWSLSTHCLAHWVVGRLAGIRFTDYFLGGPPPPRPGLKTDYATYLRALPSARAWMHASGAIATKLSPFVAMAFAAGAAAPWWAIAGLAALGVLQIVTDVLFSVKTSDWKKFLRERRVARARPVR